MMFLYLQPKFDRERVKGSKVIHVQLNTCMPRFDDTLRRGGLAPRWKKTAAEISKDNDRTQNCVV